MGEVVVSGLVGTGISFAFQQAMQQLRSREDYPQFATQYEEFLKVVEEGCDLKKHLPPMGDDSAFNTKAEDHLNRISSKVVESVRAIRAYDERRAKVGFDLKQTEIKLENILKRTCDEIRTLMQILNSVLQIGFHVSQTNMSLSMRDSINAVLAGQNPPAPQLGDNNGGDGDGDGEGPPIPAAGGEI